MSTSLVDIINQMRQNDLQDGHLHWNVSRAEKDETKNVIWVYEDIPSEFIQDCQWTGPNWANNMIIIYNKTLFWWHSVSALRQLKYYKSQQGRIKNEGSDQKVSLHTLLEETPFPIGDLSTKQFLKTERIVLTEFHATFSTCNGSRQLIFESQEESDLWILRELINNCLPLACIKAPKEIEHDTTYQYLKTCKTLSQEDLTMRQVIDFLLHYWIYPPKTIDDYHSSKAQELAVLICDYGIEFLTMAKKYMVRLLEEFQPLRKIRFTQYSKSVFV